MVNQGDWVFAKRPRQMEALLINSVVCILGGERSSVPAPATCPGVTGLTEPGPWHPGFDSGLFSAPSFVIMVENASVLKSDSGRVKRAPGLGSRPRVCDRGQVTSSLELLVSLPQKGLIPPGLVGNGRDVNTCLVNWRGSHRSKQSKNKREGLWRIFTF